MNPSIQTVIDVLKTMSIRYEIYHHAPVFTMEELYNAGIPNSEYVAKNLFLRDAKGKRHFLVVMQGSKKADLAGLRSALNSSALSFASGERLARYLGLSQGEVTPFGVLNDADHAVCVALDRDLSKAERVGLHPNDNSATLFLRFDDLVRFLHTQGNPVVMLEL